MQYIFMGTSFLVPMIPGICYRRPCSEKLLIHHYRSLILGPRITFVHTSKNYEYLTLALSFYDLNSPSSLQDTPFLALSF